MQSPRLSTLLVIGLAALLPAASRAAEPSLPRILPASTGLALHVRNVSELRANWEHTPFAHTWAEPEVQNFFAPIRDMFDPNGTNEVAAKFKADTGMTPSEMLELFPGELIFGIVDFTPYSRNEEKDNPQIFVGAQVGSNRAKIEDLLTKSAEKAAEKTKERVVEEEFQGETLHVTMKPLPDGGGEREAEAWAIVGDLLLMAEPKAVLQQVIANLKRGGATESLADAPGFAAIHRRQADADVAFYLNFESIVPAIVEGMKAREAAAGERKKPSQLDALGITPDALVHALGFDAVTCMHVAAHVGHDSTTITSGLQWREQRGLLQMLAFGEPPAPRASFVPDTWLTVSCARFSITKAYAAIRDTLRELSPALDGKFQEQLTGINTALGIDLEKDLIGGLGDEFTRADAAPPGPAGLGMLARAGDNLFGVSLNDAETFKHAVEAVLGMVPGIAKAMQSREYLGETINMFPTGGARGGGIAPTSETGVSYAITQNHLFVSIGSPAMIESAVQGQNGAPNSLWSKPEVTSILGELPSGGSLVFYYDARRLATMVFDLIAATPLPGASRRVVTKNNATASKPPTRLWDPSAKPSPEVIEKHWKSAAGAAYLDSDGIHSLFLIQHAE